jgi:DNA polymerase III epsilon subunit-like protein
MYFVFDTETSGLPAKRMPKYTDDDAYSTCRVVSIAWTVVGADFKVLRKGYFLVKPMDFVIPPEATAIHGITNQEAYASGYAIADVVAAMRADLLACKCLVAHNISFDFGVVLYELYRIRERGLINHMFGCERLCTMRLGKERLGLKKMPRLGELYAALFDGRVLEGAHNAAVDTDCCVECFCALLGPKVVAGPEEEEVVAGPEQEAAEAKEKEHEKEAEAEAEAEEEGPACAKDPDAQPER